jgi:hypothetical protein
MTLPRGRAQKDADVRLGILFRWDGTATDPHEVRQVEIIDTDGSTVLAALTEFEHQPGSGEYFVTASAAILDAVGRYEDRWSYTWVDGEGEQTATQDFYVQDTVAPTHYGQDLAAGHGYLKAFPALAGAAQDGITQGDLDAAMGIADTTIESLFGGDYDIAAWRDAPPPLVTVLWELLAAAKAMEFRDLRLGLPAEQSGSTAAQLVGIARALTERILHGRPERLYLLDASGTILRPVRGRGLTLPRAAAASGGRF